MKQIRWIELFAEIKVNLVPFISIAMFVCLGIGLFLGIQWGGTALGGATGKVYDEHNLHDIEVAFPYGLTKNDLNRLKALTGISEVEPGYSCFSSLGRGNANCVIKFQSLTKDVDVVYNLEGTMPKKNDEVAMLRLAANSMGIKIGDKLAFVHDANDKNDADGMQFLKNDTFTVTALVDHPAYMSTVVGTLGTANIGSGIVDAVVFVNESSFDIDKFQNGYPNAYIRCDELRGLDTFSSEYQDKLNALMNKVGELGGKLGTARYKKLYDEAQEKLDDANNQITDGERQLADGADKIADGEQQIIDGQRQLDDAEPQLADGKRQLDDGASQLAQNQAKINDARAQAEAKKREARQQLGAARKQLDDGQAEYDKGKAAYDAEQKEFDAAKAKFDPVSGNYNNALSLYNKVKNEDGAQLAALDEAYGAAIEAYKAAKAADDGTPEKKKAADDAWAAVEGAYAAFKAAYDTTCADYNACAREANIVANHYGSSVPAKGMAPIVAPSRDDDAAASQTSTDFAVLDLAAVIVIVETSTVDVAGQKVPVLEVNQTIAQAETQLNDAKDQLDAGKKKLDAGRAAYNQKLAEFRRATAEVDAQINQAQSLLDQKRVEYNEAKALYEQKLAEYNSGKVQLEDARRELEEAREKLEQAQKDLDEAKKKYADAKEQFDEMKEYDWLVLARLEVGSVSSVDMMTTIQGRMRWAMALLFVLVGLFVCYSAVSRLVNDQITQIGTKKAVGFREGEIGLLYYKFTGLAVLVGTALAGLLAVFVVQLIMNPVAAESQVVDPFPPHFDLVQLILGGLIELVLILLSTWVAVHGMLRRNAVDLLSGDSKTSTAKTHFWEKWGVWQNMSLFSQTVVNNCINDTRRVVATLIGVTGCTALIVTAVTLTNNVSKSFERHYGAVYDFDTRVYVDTKVDGAAQNVAKELDKMGLEHATAHLETLQVRQANGYRAGGSFYVPDNIEEFGETFHVIPDDSGGVGQADLNGEGVWISTTYAEHMNLKAGDEFVATEASGQAHTFKVAGVFECYILRNEFVINKKEYKKAFGSDPKNNVLLVDKGDTDLDTLRTRLSKVKGFDTVSDDYKTCSWAYDTLAKLLNIVVLIYIGLSALMAIVVLLNLDVMFVDEKKRELIVLMICGFSAKDAKAYIYRDSIVLTILGIILGVALGAGMGTLTVSALEPSFGFFLKSFNVLAAGAGILMSGVFSTAVLFWSLRRIPRFDLTDINRF